MNLKNIFNKKENKYLAIKAKKYKIILKKIKLPMKIIMMKSNLEK